MIFPEVVKNNFQNLVEYIKSLEIKNIDVDEKKVDHDLLLETFVHKSFSADFNNTVPHNERLEFLGDWVLGAIINELLFVNNPKMKESSMTLFKIALVRESTLAEVAKDIWLGKKVFISKGEEKANGREKFSILSDALEALIGFIFLEFGFDAAKYFVEKFVYIKFKKLESINVKSHKTLLQEYVQKHYKQIPEYKDSEHEVEGNWNVLKYKSEIYIQWKLESEWFGQNKRKAQSDAAKKLLEKYKKVKARKK